MRARHERGGAPSGAPVRRPAAPSGLLGLQRAAGNRAAATAVQRREHSSVVASVRDAVGIGASVLGPGDWYEKDRLDLNVDGPSLANRFVTAARHNTLVGATGEYPDISQRNDYYKALDFLIRTDPTFATTPAAKAIKFFRAAAEVTGYTGIGGLELLPLAVTPPDLLVLVKTINQRLFEVNADILRRVGSTGDLVDPRSVTSAPTDAFDFDLRMVETEQGEVEKLLGKLHLSTPSRAILNVMVNMNVQHGGKDPDYMAWAKKVYGVTSLDFYSQAHRMGIGRAMVHLAHGKKYADFEAFIKAGAPKYASTPRALP